MDNEKYVVLKVKKEELQDSINGLEGLKVILQLTLQNHDFMGMGKKDSEELGKHFDTAIKAMTMILGYMKNQEGQ